MGDERTNKDKNSENPAVTLFREYLRIKSVQPDPDYDGCVKFLQKYADDLKLPCRIIELSPGKPIILMTWEGTDPSLPSILLNSHTDVVPVYPEEWKYDAFAAHKDEQGNIYARGTQDMKCVGIWYLEAIRRLKAEGRTFPRTFHLTYVPDEEIGGVLGMKLFIQHEEYKKLNVAYALDEGLANPTDAFTVYYGERFPWWVKVTCKGKPGHGSRFIEDNAAEKLRKVMNSFLAFRDSEEKRLKLNPSLRLGDVTTTNLNIIKGGIANNVVPDKYEAWFDFRIATDVDLSTFEEQIQTWCTEAGPDVTFEFVQKNTEQTLTPITKDDPWWNAFSTPLEKMGYKLECEVFPAATDSRFLRSIGLPAIGFSPMNKTPILLHDHNEFLNEDVFIKGIDVYCQLLPSLGSVPAI